VLDFLVVFSGGFQRNKFRPGEVSEWLMELVSKSIMSSSLFCKYRYSKDLLLGSQSCFREIISTFGGSIKIEDQFGMENREV